MSSNDPGPTEEQKKAGVRAEVQFFVDAFAANYLPHAFDQRLESMYDFQKVFGDVKRPDYILLNLGHIYVDVKATTPWNGHISFDRKKVLRHGRLQDQVNTGLYFAVYERKGAEIDPYSLRMVSLARVEEFDDEQDIIRVPVGVMSPGFKVLEPHKLAPTPLRPPPLESIPPLPKPTLPSGGVGPAKNDPPPGPIRGSGLFIKASWIYAVLVLGLSIFAYLWLTKSPVLLHGGLSSGAASVGKKEKAMRGRDDGDEAASSKGDLYRLGEYPDGKVYTIPDCESLVGKDLNHAWLRGTFLVRGKMDGNAYYAVPRNRPIGLPIIDAFTSTGSTPFVIRFLQSPPFDPVGRTMLFEGATPLKIDRVLRKDGRLIVVTTSHFRYR